MLALYSFNADVIEYQYSKLGGVNIFDVQCTKYMLHLYCQFSSPHSHQVSHISVSWATFLWSLTSLRFDWALFRTINVHQRGGKTESERLQRLLAMTI